MQLHTMFGYYSPEIVTALVALIGSVLGLALARPVVRFIERRM